MRFGVNTWTWTSPFTTAAAIDLFPKVRAMGFDLVEIALEDPDLIEMAEVGRLLREHALGVTICGAFGPTRDLSSEDRTVAENGVAYIERSLRVCEVIGAPLFVGPAYAAVGKARPLPPDERKRELDRSIANLKRVAVAADDCGVTLGIEPLNRFETDMINTSTQVCALVDAVGHPRVRVHLDTFHMRIEEASIYEAVVLAGERLCHVHASESNRGTPGAGLARWDQLAQGLTKINYDGALVIETFTPEVREIARAAAIWRPLAPSQDALARDGLKFLRALMSRHEGATA